MLLHDFGTWPGLTQSQAIRFSLEMAHYLLTLNSEHIDKIADEYYPILAEALEDLDYSDYRIAARSLPALVTGLLCEDNRGWDYEHGDQHHLDPEKLVEELRKLDAAGRIGILTCVIAERYRRQAAMAKEKGKKKADEHADGEKRLADHLERARNIPGNQNVKIAKPRSKVKLLPTKTPNTSPSRNIST